MGVTTTSTTDCLATPIVGPGKTEMLLSGSVWLAQGLGFAALPWAATRTGCCRIEIMVTRRSKSRTSPTPTISLTTRTGTLSVQIFNSTDQIGRHTFSRKRGTSRGSESSLLGRAPPFPTSKSSTNCKFTDGECTDTPGWSDEQGYGCA